MADYHDCASYLFIPQQLLWCLLSSAAMLPLRSHLHQRSMRCSLQQTVQFSFTFLINLLCFFILFLRTLIQVIKQFIVQRKIPAAVFQLLPTVFSPPGFHSARSSSCSFFICRRFTSCCTSVLAGLASYSTLTDSYCVRKP